MPKKIDLVGRRFGNKVVLALAGYETKSRRRLWRAKCDCGHEYTYTSQGLLRATGCQYCSHKGPRPHRRKRPYEAIYNALVQRGRHPVSLTYEQFAELTSQTSCHYCGDSVTWSQHRRVGESTASNLDRKDNWRPYEAGNVVVCCIRCNKAKNTHFTYDEWKQLGGVIRSWRALALLQKELEAAHASDATGEP